MKVCIRCEKSKDEAEFRIRRTGVSSTPNWRTTTCKSCDRAYSREYYKVHREALRLYVGNRRACKSEEINVLQRDYYAANKEKCRRVQQVFRRENAEALREKRLKDYSGNRDERRMKLRLYRHNNPERVRAWKRNAYYKDVDESRATTRASTARSRCAGKLTRELVQQVYEINIKRFGTLTCYLCLKSIAFGDDNLEHKTPIVRGGRHELLNMDVAHKSCNLSKGVRTYGEYIMDFGVLKGK